MKTQLIVFERPNNSRVISDTIINTAALKSINSSTYSNAGSTLQQYSQTNLPKTGNPYIYPVNPKSAEPLSNAGMEIDLYDNVSLPITYNIIDIKEPEKRKTSWSKTITIPGTKNNNRVFSHIYELGGDAWIKIGGKSVWTAFNPNLKTEIIVLNDGIQVLKGNMQLKSATRDIVGNIEYEIALNGDLTSLFFDIGNKKLSDLDWSMWTHNWTKENIVDTWTGTCRLKDGSTYAHTPITAFASISGIFMNQATGRLSVNTFSNHSFSVGDYIVIAGDTAGAQSIYKSIYGQWIITEVLSLKSFSLNYFYPKVFGGQPKTPLTTFAFKTTATGQGYVYPMISWGDEYDFNSFPVTSFVPGFFLKGIWDKIFADTNSSYESEFLNSQFFKRQIMIQKKPSYDLTPDQIEKRKFWVGNTQSFYSLVSAIGTTIDSYPQYNIGGTESTSLFPSSSPNRLAFKAESGATGTFSFYDKYDNFNQDTRSWIVVETGEYQINSSFRYTVWCDMNGYSSNPFPNGTASFDPSNPNYFYRPGAFGSGAAAVSSNGLIVTAKIKRKRNGQPLPDLASYTQNIFMNNGSYYSSVFNDRSLGSSNGNWPYFGRYQPSSWQNIQVNLTSTSAYFAAGDEVWVEISVKVNAPGAGPSNLGRSAAISFYEEDTEESSSPRRENIRGEWSFKLESGSYIYSIPSIKSGEGSLINGKEFLPKDFSCKDFLLTIIKMYNLHIEPDKQIERKYYIEPRDAYYYTGSGGASDYVDWTDKIDNLSIQIIPLGELIAKNYIFENKEEADFWNKKFKDDRGRPYSYYRKEIVNDFLKNEIKISIPVGSTVMINNPPNSDVVMPAILQKESNSTFKPVSNSLPRILIYGGIRPYTMERGGSSIALQNPQVQNGQGWELLSSVSSTSGSSSQYYYYPYAGTVDSPTDPYYDINWFNMEQNDFVYWNSARWSNHNLYNAYWSNFIDEISDPSSKVIKCSVRLTPKDIYELDFRKIYVIDGHYLRLQKVVDYDAVIEGLTSCEFLKLKSPVKWKRKSIIADDLGLAATEFTPDTIPVIGTNLYIPDYVPKNKTPDFGWGNSSVSSSLSNNSTVTINGLSNFVAPTGKNIKINGNENAIGDGSTNIHISSGNGNFISGGITNVNIIGTNKKFINESDVTYINGIRYKNGSPISRSNIIDGGIAYTQSQTLYNRQSDNTTANVVSASEDVVISAGSTSFENIIDSGVDRILADLPDLGFATSLNPNPRTNLTGGFIIESPTASITERVRRSSFFKQ